MKREVGWASICPAWIRGETTSEPDGLKCRCGKPDLNTPVAKQAAEKRLCSVILSGAKNLSLFLFLYLNRKEILRFAQNDRTRLFFGPVKAD
jgi:hypothetical protein